KGRIGIIAVILIIIIACFGKLIGVFTDFLWFRELGYTSVFWKEILTKLELGVPVFLIVFFICAIYLKLLKKRYYKTVDIGGTSGSEKTLNGIAWVLSAILGLIVSVTVFNNLWFELLKYTNSTDFSILDPIFNQDVSFYIFKLEFITHANTIIMGTVVGFAIVTLIYYLILMSMRRPQIFEKVPPQQDGQQQQQQGGFGAFGAFGQAFGQGGDAFGQGGFGGYNRPQQQTTFNKENMGRLLSIAAKEFVVLGVIFFLMIAFNFYLKQYTLLYTGSSGVVFGAGFTDIKITLWVYRIIMVLGVVSAITFALGIKQRKWKTVLTVPVIMIVIAIIGGGASMLVQNLVVAPDEISKESTYLENNIAFTRYAYDLQDIRIQEFAATNDLTKDDIINNMETISNIRINDYEPAKKFYNQTQSIRLYYFFHDVDVDRYMINGEYTQVFLSAREIDETKTTDQWLSTHLKYTHGYGVTLSRVDQVTESGQPAMMIDSIPPVSQVEEIEITRPEIYFGEGTNNYIITNTDEQEFDYPSGDNNVYCTYEGNAGIKLNPINRILFAIKEQSLKLLVSNNIDSNSRILINRDIEDRVKTLAPFLEYDSDPYIVTVDGGLYWIYDAYTTSRYYPYSEPFNGTGGINYIRNSVKVVIDAYNGDTNFYIVDEEDPIAMTLQKIYPDMFKGFDEMPEGLQAHIRYPNTMFTIQANVYTKYHMTDVNIFYQNEDRWSIATEIYGMDETTMSPIYYIMKLPGEDKAEFINSIPYTPSGKYNMTALLVARNDGEHYGDLVLYQLPKDRIIYGPRQIEAQIDQDTEIAADFTLWNSAGSTYTRGNMFVIPIEDSLVYVEPVYLESANSSLPEVKRVIVYYNERIAYAETLAAALDEMFGKGAGDYLAGGNYDGDVTPDDPSGTDAPGQDVPGDDMDRTPEELAQLANDTFNKAVEAQQRGDWAAYGVYLNELEGILKEMLGENAASEPEIPDMGTGLPGEMAPDAGGQTMESGLSDTAETL
ncbi:MAG: UPF0182 family protein, partial [Clostridiales bacterium]|nr:UPF0182 family protein [Clostridiales bacterium]